MKKILSVLFVSLLCLCMPSAIFADEDEEISGDNATVTLIASKASAYTLRLPRTVDVSLNSKSFDVYAKGDIWADKKLDVTVSAGDHKLSDVVSGGKADVAIDVNVANGSFASNELSADYTNRKATFTVTHADLAAGNYSCELPLTIALNDAN